MSYRKDVLLGLLRGKSFFIFLLSSLLFFGFNIWINELTGEHFSLEHLSVLFNLLHIIFLIIISLLVGVVIALIVYKIQEYRSLHGVTGIGVVGAFLGLMAGGCAGCIGGLFPAFMGLFGASSSSLLVLPWNGMELNLLSIALLLVGIYFLTKAPVCKVKPTKNKKVKTK